jgi:hypothetical protein
MGESIRKISREEHRDFRTIAKILQNNPAKLKEYLALCHDQFYPLATVVLETISRALENGNTRLAYRVLVDAGAVPPPGQFPWVMAPKKTETRETVEKKKLVNELVEIAIEIDSTTPARERLGIACGQTQLPHIDLCLSTA